LCSFLFVTWTWAIGSYIFNIWDLCS
jgi:hypothetical protein